MGVWNKGNRERQRGREQGKGRGSVQVTCPVLGKAKRWDVMGWLGVGVGVGVSTHFPQSERHYWTHGDCCPS